MKLVRIGKKPKVTPSKELARLEAMELYSNNEQRRIIDDTEKTLSMLRCSYQALWATFKTKYSLPADVELDQRTGAVYEKPEVKLNGGGS